MSGQVFLGWHDPAKKKSAAKKLDEAVARFRQRSGGADPAMVLTTRETAQELAAAGCALDVRWAAFVPAGTLYLGYPEGEGG